MICTCPKAAALPDVPVIECPETFGQIQKVAFQRLTKADGTKNSFTTTADIKLKASWTPLLVAADGTKVVMSPYIQAPTAEGGAAREFGGGNETLGGIPEVIGAEPTPFKGVIRQAPQTVIAALKQFVCEAKGGGLGIFLIDENGNIGAIKGGTTQAPTYSPIPIRSFFVADKTLGGLEAPDSNAIQWSFLPNWSDSLVKIAPTDFSPLTDLFVPAT